MRFLTSVLILASLIGATFAIDNYLRSLLGFNSVSCSLCSEIGNADFQYMSSTRNYTLANGTYVTDLIRVAVASFGAPLVFIQYYNDVKQGGSISINLATLSASSLKNTLKNGWKSTFDFKITKATSGLAVSYPQIVEFNDTNGDKIYTEGVDNVTSTYNLDNADWLPITQGVNSTGKGYNYLNLTTSDGVFTLIVKMSSRPINFAATSLYPNATKIDIIINKYPFQGAKTYLALNQLMISTATPSSINIQAGKTYFGGNSVYYDWVTSADVQTSGDNSTYNASVYANAWNASLKLADNSLNFGLITTLSKTAFSATKNETWYTFGAIKPVRVEWDPSLQVNDNPNTASSSTPSTTPEPTSPSTEKSGAAMVNFAHKLLAIALIALCILLA